MQKYQSLLERYEKLHLLEKEILCGVHSGMNLCCILWYAGNFSEFLWWLNDCEVYNTEIDGEIVSLPYFKKDSLWFVNGARYVPCPECLIKILGGHKPTTVKSCDCKDKK